RARGRASRSSRRRGRSESGAADAVKMRLMRCSLLLGIVLLGLAVSAVAGSVRTVVVFYFDNDIGDSNFDYLGKGFADMMVTDLTVVPEIQVVEREKLEAILQELKF